ncbi:MAG: response regulator [Candidatus Contendobacter sp.]|nr:response regulator [Candidatus Contendobacter sp.]
MTGEMILIVDDHEAIRKLLTLVLTQTGYQVRSAENGQQAIEQLLDWAPHLIILDAMMPIMDGLQFLDWRAQHDLLRIPVLALTGMKHPGSREQLLAAGANAVLFKPVRLPVLLPQIEQLLATPNPTVLN